MGNLSERNADLGEKALVASCPDFGENGTDKQAVRLHIQDTITNLLQTASRYGINDWGNNSYMGGELGLVDLARHAAVEEQLDEGAPDQRPAGMLFEANDTSDMRQHPIDCTQPGCQRGER